MTAPQSTGSAAEAQPEAVAAGLPAKEIQGRSLGQIAWLRLRRDKVALASGVVIVLLILLAISALLLDRVFGVLSPNTFHQDLIDGSTLAPRRVRRDECRAPARRGAGQRPRHPHPHLRRLLDLAADRRGRTVLSVLIGTTMGLVAGYFGGWVDAVVGRIMDGFLAFPVLVFAFALAGVIPDAAFGLSGDQLRILLLIFIIGFFNWPYIGRIVRGQALTLREREFVDAARSLGAKGPWVLVRELLPNLVAPILVYATLLIPTNILFEAALSFLGVGVKLPTATWGRDAVGRGEVLHAPLLHVVAWTRDLRDRPRFNLFGDGLRDALDPRSR